MHPAVTDDEMTVRFLCMYNVDQDYIVHASAIEVS
jgi:hypothetical protein